MPFIEPIALFRSSPRLGVDVQHRVVGRGVPRVVGPVPDPVPVPDPTMHHVPRLLAPVPT